MTPKVQGILEKLAALEDKVKASQLVNPELDMIVLCLPVREHSSRKRRLWQKTGPYGNICGSDATREYVWFYCKDVLKAIEKARKQLATD